MLHLISFRSVAPIILVLTSDSGLQIRDAELVKQGFVTLREKTALFGVNWSDVMLDVFVKTIVMP